MPYEVIEHNKIYFILTSSMALQFLSRSKLRYYKNVLYYYKYLYKIIVLEEVHYFKYYAINIPLQESDI